MGRTARVLFLVLLCVLAVACRGASLRPVVAAQGPRRGGAFDAKTVDVSVDWESRPPGSAEAGAPASVALTASDGTGLRLVSLDARAVVHGPLAFTEVHLAFENSTPRVLEGTFSMTLPESASLSRFAMRIGAHLQEGEVVERDAARATYERFLHKNVDPALFEKDRGNVFRGRVFPIFAGQKKEIVLSYAEELASPGQPYRFPLRGLPKLDELDVQLYVPAQKQAYVLHRDGLQPDKDFVHAMGAAPDAADTKAGAAGALQAVRAGAFAVVRVSAAERVEAPSPIGALAVLIDSSASRAATYDEDLARVEAIVAASGATSVKVACFDQEVVPVASVRDAGKRRPGGASDLGAALRWAKGAGASRVVLVTDGVPSAGALEVHELAAEAQALRAARVERLDVLAAGASRDDALLRALAMAGLPRAGVVADVRALAPEAIVRRLLVENRSSMRVTPANGWLAWPTAFDGQRHGLVFMKADAPDRPLTLDVDGAPRALRIEEAPEPLVARAVAAASIRRLMLERNAPGTAPSRRDAIRAEVVALSVEHRVLSDFTSMLVLERDQDFERFRIERRALKDVLVVGPKGVVRLPRASAVLPPEAREPASPFMDYARRDDAKARDSDGDGIPDAADLCPNEPETFNGFEDEDGCPDKARVVIEDNFIIIMPQVRFRAGSASIEPESLDIIEAVAQTLKAHPEVDLLEIHGHTDAKGTPEGNQRISESRARAVLEELVKRGVPRKRLAAKGFGARLPIEPGDDEEARAKNRRAEFRMASVNGQPTGAEHTTPRPHVPLPNRGKAPAKDPPYTGPMADVVKLLDGKKPTEALEVALAWRGRAPSEMLAAVAEGMALEALARWPEAARAYGSMLDLATRPEHRRAAAERLEAISARHAPALELAVDAYRRALAERPEVPSSHRLLAFALARAGKVAAARDVIAEARKQAFDARRFPGVAEVLKSDEEVLSAALGGPALGPSTRFVLVWETDESDLDLFVRDAKGGLVDPIADATLGYGPEVVVPAKTGTYTVEIALQERRTSGYALGKVSIMRHDGRAGLVFEDRPFVVMNEHAFLPLGRAPAP